MLAFLWTVIADLYGDSAKINGRHNVSDQLRNLRQILNNYDFESLCSFFAENLWIQSDSYSSFLNIHSYQNRSIAFSAYCAVVILRKISGGAGVRTRGLAHAKRMWYHYTTPPRVLTSFRETPLSWSREGPCGGRGETGESPFYMKK